MGERSPLPSFLWLIVESPGLNLFSMKNLKNSRQILKVFAINFALILLVLEGVPLLFYLITEGRLIYSRDRTQNEAREALQQTGVRMQEDDEEREAIVERFQPYFGYVLKPGIFGENQFGLKVNNYGFFTLYDYPFQKANDNQFIIGIFGGSVAVDFANNEVVNKGATTTLIQQLKSVPELVNKELIILNFAHGGYKQPQQLLILNYFLSIGQEFDLILNIDGFNEVALPPLNNEASVPISMPSFQHIQPLTSLANTSLPVIMAIADVTKTKEKLQEKVEQLENCNLASCYALTSYQVDTLLKQYQDGVSELEELQLELKKNESSLENSLISMPKNKQVLGDAIAFDQMVDLWATSSQMIHQVLSDRNIPYFHVIQPNQYHPTERTFTAEEKNLFVNTPYLEGVQQGYPRLLERVETLQNSGINVINAVTVFDEEKESVYRDNCCHYNPKGQEIFTEYIGQSVGEKLKSSQ